MPLATNKITEYVKIIQTHFHTTAVMSGHCWQLAKVSLMYQNQDGA